jgi:alpha-L-rhamnosidase
MKSALIISMMLGVAVLQAKSPLSLHNLKCEYKIDPIGIDILQPRFSWELQSAERAVLQTAYQIRVATEPEALQKNKNLIWDSGKTLTDNSIHIPYGGPALNSRRRYFWQVRVWDDKGRISSWSSTTFWEMGLLQPGDWHAAWIEPDLPEDSARSMPCPMLRKEFLLKGDIASARVYVTSHGLYEMELNGKKVGDQLFTPGWTAYDRRIQYQTYDVTTLLQSGPNAIGVFLGDGWYRGFLGFNGQRNIYGKTLALCLQLEITYRDGRSEQVISDESWLSSTGPILSSDIYNGEIYDSRLEKKGWSKAGYGAQGWSAVRVIPTPSVNLVAPEGPPVRRMEELKPQRIFKTPKGELVADFGQIMTGWGRIKVNGHSGDRIILTHFEVLDSEGNVYLKNLRAARQRDEFILDNRNNQIFEPHFTFHGFRYVQVEGYPGELSADKMTGIVIHSDYTPSGTFYCSDSLINRLQHNIQWSQKGNFVDVPTDCPQRDERLGWTGDAQVFARTACFNGDVASFYTKWLKDLALDQKPSGAVPFVIPNVLDKDNPTSNVASAAWADAAVIVPWTVYLCYGDLRLLEQQYPSMRAWVEYMAGRVGEKNIWSADFTFGDWLAYATTNSDYPGATTDKDLICQAYFIHSTDLLQRSAALLGKSDDAARYMELKQKSIQAFRNEFVTPNGRLASNTQTAYSLALVFDLLPNEQRPAAARRLTEDVHRFGHLTTGFVGTPLLCHVLSTYNYLDEAFMLLMRKTYPSWLYPITHDATTIWERWDGIKADGSFQDAGMNSFNHYAYGAIGDWLYRVVAGIEIDPEQPGYKHVLFQPHPGGGLNSAGAELRSVYGIVACEWKIMDGQMQIHLTVPANTTAKAMLPNALLTAVKEGKNSLDRVDGVHSAEQRGENVEIVMGSGHYTFTYLYK